MNIKKLNEELDMLVEDQYQNEFDSEEYYIVTFTDGCKDDNFWCGDNDLFYGKKHIADLYNGEDFREIADKIRTYVETKLGKEIEEIVDGAGQSLLESLNEDEQFIKSKFDPREIANQLRADITHGDLSDGRSWSCGIDVVGQEGEDGDLGLLTKPLRDEALRNIADVVEEGNLKDILNLDLDNANLDISDSLSVKDSANKYPHLIEIEGNHYYFTIRFDIEIESDLDESLNEDQAYEESLMDAFETVRGAIETAMHHIKLESKPINFNRIANAMSQLKLAADAFELANDPEYNGRPRNEILKSCYNLIQEAKKHLG